MIKRIQILENLRTFSWTKGVLGCNLTFSKAGGDIRDNRFDDLLRCKRRLRNKHQRVDNKWYKLLRVPGRLDGKQQFTHDA